MKDTKQIALIHRFLSANRDRKVQELARLNNMIIKKQQMIQKIANYQNEGANNNSGKINVVPALLQNKLKFTGMISQLIQNEEKELEKIKIAKDNVESKIFQLEKKIEAFSNLLTENEKEALYKKEKIEQTQLDELAILKEKSEYYE